MTGGESWRLIRSGSPDAFIDALERDALAHPAVRHPYIERLARGDVPDVRHALWDFGAQYAHYSEYFDEYVAGVLGSIKDARHAEALRAMLAEEHGDPDSPTLEGRPHRELFRRFLDAIRPEGEPDPEPCETVLIWRDLFLQKCRSPNAAVGLGGLGLGTETVVSRIYARLIRALESHTELEPDDFVFFTLHAACDDEHGEIMRSIAVDLARGPREREALRFGALSALNLRMAFWDVMLGRALAPCPAH